MGKDRGGFMRIIAGDYKGRRLETPKGAYVRPTGEKVKEAVFSMLAPYIEDSVVLDLFAGTGNLGLEALSRGSSFCYFVDNNRDSVALIKRNIAYCKAEEYSMVCWCEAENSMSQIRRKVDVVFMDPPFKKGLLDSCFSAIREGEILNPEGLLVVEHGSDELLPEEFQGFFKFKEKKYGNVIVSIFKAL